ncbi:MAG TPA: hypothetical protein VMA32_16420 [Streptosporangiaceae bacterium]|nr:hypothetical protein [Streptosporangiaceae bacterium]
METIIGFVAGYIAGCQDGPDGVKRLRATAADIMSSDEVRRLMAEAMSVAGGLVSRAMSGRSLGNLSGTVEGVTDMLVHRSSAVSKRSRVA